MYNTKYDSEELKYIIKRKVGYENIAMAKVFNRPYGPMSMQAFFKQEMVVESAFVSFILALVSLATQLPQSSLSQEALQVTGFLKSCISKGATDDYITAAMSRNVIKKYYNWFEEIVKVSLNIKIEIPIYILRLNTFQHAISACKGTSVNGVVRKYVLPSDAVCIADFGHEGAIFASKHIFNYVSEKEVVTVKELLR